MPLLQIRRSEVTFLSDGGDTVRDLQYIMHPEAEHLLDWFHVTMRLTLLNQFAKGLKQSDPEEGARITKGLDSAKWYLWHGNVKNAMDKFDYCYCLLEDEDLHYANRLKFQKTIEDMLRYIDNNRHLIPNYGEKYRYGETITTSFVESTVNEVVAKRMVKKQQMQWSPQGAHCLLQTLFFGKCPTLCGALVSSLFVFSIIVLGSVDFTPHQVTDFVLWRKARWCVQQ